MDDESIGTVDEWHDCLSNLAKVNRFLGGWKALRDEIDRLPILPKNIVDVATGGADSPRRLLDHLAARGARAKCLALDHSNRILQIAEKLTGQRTDISLMQGDARQLPLADRSFDVGMMNLSLHHFDPDDAIAVLRELARVAITVIVNDVRRSRIAWAFARFVFPLFTRNRLTRNDAPLSVLRAYAPAELQELACRAGWTRVSVRKHPGYRMTLVGGFST